MRFFFDEPLNTGCDRPPADPLEAPVTPLPRPFWARWFHRADPVPLILTEQERKRQSEGGYLGVA